MSIEIERIRKTRQYLINGISELTVEQLNRVPAGFNNNIVWNLGHIIAAQQGICYVRRGAPVVVDEKYYLQYKPGTKPDEFVDAAEVENLKQLLLSSLDRFEADYQGNAFANYPAWTTRYGVEIANIDDILQFLLYHEGLHTGTIMAVKRLVSVNAQ